MDFLGRGAALPALVLAFLLTGCASLPGFCPPGLQPMTSAELIFGRSIAGGGSVSDADWAAFVDKEVTPRFPDGLSVFDAHGQWRTDGGRIIREPSKLLLIIIKGTKDEQAKLEAIRAAYKSQFKQESVLLFEHRECAAF